MFRRLLFIIDETLEPYISTDAEVLPVEPQLIIPQKRQFTLKQMMIFTAVIALLVNIFGWMLWERWADEYKRTQGQRAISGWQAKVKHALRQSVIEPWAGTYKRSDAHADFVLSIAPQSGWVMDKTIYCSSKIEDPSQWNRPQIDGRAREGPA